MKLLGRQPIKVPGQWQKEEAEEGGGRRRSVAILALYLGQMRGSRKQRC
jgi:hypothetical protein